MNAPSHQVVALNLSFLRDSLDTIVLELERAPDRWEWTAEAAARIIDRIGNVESLLNEVKGQVAEAKRAAVLAPPVRGAS